MNAKRSAARRASYLTMSSARAVQAAADEALDYFRRMKFEDGADGFDSIIATLELALHGRAITHTEERSNDAEMANAINVLRAARDAMLVLSDTEDSTGCSGDLTVVGALEYARLQEILTNDQCLAAIGGTRERFVVDGLQFPEEDSEMLGDGQFPPFRVFDTAKQDYVDGEYRTRERAEWVAGCMNKNAQR